MESAFVETGEHPKIHYAILRPKRTGVPRAPVFVIPGFGEAIGRYEEAMQLFTGRGFLVAAHDLRGQGDSEGRPGHIDSFEDYLSDAQAVLSALSRDPDWSSAGKPILYGHSTGGLIASHLALRAPQQFRGLCLGSPYFGLALRTPAWKVQLARSISKLYPTFSQPTGINGKLVTHDPAMVADSDGDPKAVSQISVRWFTETEAAQELLFADADRLNLPLFCQAAGDDRIASLAQTREVLMKAQSEDKELIVREGAFHELHREVDRELYLNTFADKFEQWSAPPNDAPPV